MTDEHSDNIEKLDKNFVEDDAPEGGRWVDLRDFTLEGKGWEDTPNPYDRLPAHAKSVVPDGVWNLGNRPAGMSIRFITDATTISARWTVRYEPLGKPHMPATGSSGLDLYVWNGSKWRWTGAGRPNEFPTSEGALVKGELAPIEREYRLYLPLYNSLESIFLGIPPEGSLKPGPRDEGKPIVIYGTSIVQGGVASRPGMGYTAILSRRLHRETINLGFSGNGRMETQLAELLGELDACAYVVDCLPNMAEPVVDERAVPFVRTLRAARPETPIVLVENIIYQDAHLVPSRHQRCTSSNLALRRAYEQLVGDGVHKLIYVPGDALLGDDGDATVDGTHPTDLGFLRIADALEPVLRPIM